MNLGHHEDFRPTVPLTASNLEEDIGQTPLAVEEEEDVDWKPTQPAEVSENVYNTMDVGFMATLLDRNGVPSKKASQISNATTAILMQNGYIDVSGQQTPVEVPLKLIFVAKKFQDKRVRVRQEMNENFFSNLPG